ncbi:MAG: hypothetical protein R3C13_14090 [Hyphomonas sp.]|uniref:hypothetical protein n=1 Tax=Hyphomonas sp. TaxID=87 RepID=UPI00352768B6
MSFREKSAWAMVFILISAGAYYFNKVFAISQALGQTAPPIIGLVIFYVVMVVIASIVIMSIIAGASGKEANAPVDEREKVILDKAGHWSGYVLAIGVFTGMMNFGVTSDGNLLFHICFASLMVSQIAEYGFQILLFRRGV